MLPGLQVPRYLFAGFSSGFVRHSSLAVHGCRAVAGLLGRLGQALRRHLHGAARAAAVPQSRGCFARTSAFSRCPNPRCNRILKPWKRRSTGRWCTPTQYNHRAKKACSAACGKGDPGGEVQAQIRGMVDREIADQLTDIMMPVFRAFHETLAEHELPAPVHDSILRRMDARLAENEIIETLARQTGAKPIIVGRRVEA